MSIPRGLARFAGVAAIACLALVAAGGAARGEGGVWLAAPSWGAAALAVLAVAVVAAIGWRGDGLGAAAGFAAPLALLLAGVPLAGVQAASGPPLFALAAAGSALALASAGAKLPGRALMLPTVFAFFVATGGHSSVRVGPEGDEPHYLMVAESLLRDGDLALDRDYAEGRYAQFHDAPLAPHYRVRGRHREILSLHAVGLSVLVLPAWALAGYAGVTVFMALLAALLVGEIGALVRELGGSPRTAAATAAAAALSPPLLPYAGLVFTEVPAALLLVFALRLGRRAGLTPGGALAIGLATAALPWLNVRYAPLALLAAGHALWRQVRVRQVIALLGPLLFSAAGIASYHRVLYGFWDPRRVYGTRPEFAWATLAEGLPGLFLDQEFGLLVYAPVLVLALPGLWLLLRRDRKLGVTALAAIVFVVAVAGSWHMWRGGFNPPARFLVPIAPLLFVAVGLTWARRGLTAGSALLLGWGLWVGLAGALEPQLVHRDRDGVAPLFRVLSGAREWTSLLPAYVLGQPARQPLAAAWAFALLAAVPWRSRRPSALRSAGAAMALVATAQLAASLAGEPTGDRDAVRVAGKPALRVPGWNPVAAVVPEWRPEDLGVRPLYEPHRHPGGLSIGRRLPVPPGRYQLELDARPLGLGTPLEVWWQRDEPGGRWEQLRPAGPSGRFEAPWEDLRAGRDAVNLRLRGGPPALVGAVRLEPGGGRR